MARAEMVNGCQADSDTTAITPSNVTLLPYESPGLGEPKLEGELWFLDTGGEPVEEILPEDWESIDLTQIQDDVWILEVVIGRDIAPPLPLPSFPTSPMRTRADLPDSFRLRWIVRGEIVFEGDIVHTEDWRDSGRQTIDWQITARSYEQRMEGRPLRPAGFLPPLLGLNHQENGYADVVNARRTNRFITTSA